MDHPHPRTTLDPPEPEFGNAGRDSAARSSRASAVAAARSAPEFRSLRRRTLGFLTPAGILFVAWYLTYAVLGAYDRAWMSEPVVGSINVGLLLGLGQFVSTGVLTAVWVLYQRRQLEPRAAAVRAQGGDPQ